MLRKDPNPSFNLTNVAFNLISHHCELVPVVMPKLSHKLFPKSKQVLNITHTLTHTILTALSVPKSSQDGF